ncbi:hypothetical protein CEXT_214351 [Caerostris extrusa]|uniref:Uncharacterized protein n=1 Tax=Caerostris extrusa TaxID=172846 RepID=A0AAV4NCX7_CAEEX|nr:hypothetical protein CEXT_214351 [Caerostris extrusa]
MLQFQRTKLSPFTTRFAEPTEGAFSRPSLSKSGDFPCPDPISGADKELTRLLPLVPFGEKVVQDLNSTKAVNKRSL